MGKENDVTVMKEYMLIGTAGIYSIIERSSFEEALEYFKSLFTGRFTVCAEEIETGRTAQYRVCL